MLPRGSLRGAGTAPRARRRAHARRGGRRLHSVAMNLSALFDLTGRRALVTGGGGGLGSAFAAALAGAGARVAVVGRSATVEESASSGALAVVADLSRRDELRRSFEEA